MSSWSDTVATVQRHLGSVATSPAYVSIHRNEDFDGNLIYIVVESAAAFNLIDLPEERHQNGCRSKIHNSQNQHLVFQYWERKQ